MAGHASRKVSGLRLLEKQETAEVSLRSAVAVGLEQARRGELLDGEEVFEALEKLVNRRHDSRGS